MNVFVIGINCFTLESLSGDQRLKNFHRLIEMGWFGRLDSSTSYDTDQLWQELASSLIPDMNTLKSSDQGGRRISKEVLIGNQEQNQGKEAIFVGLTPNQSYPSWVGGLFVEKTEHENLEKEILEADTIDKLKKQVFSISQLKIDFVRFLMDSFEWDYIQFVDGGIGWLQHHPLLEDRGLRERVVHDYVIFLDEQIGSLFEFLADDTVVLVVSICDLPESDGFFILAGANIPARGPIEGAQFIDLAPTILELTGKDIQATMDGNSLLKVEIATSEEDLSNEEEAILRERLSGLGYF